MDKDIEQMRRAAGVLIDGRELLGSESKQIEKLMTELGVLTARHPDLKVFIYNINEAELHDIHHRQFTDFLKAFRKKIQILHSGDQLKKRLLIEISFDALKAASVRESYTLEASVHALWYDRPGALEGFIRLLESKTEAELLKGAIAGYAFIGPNGRWQIHESVTDLLTSRLQSSYAIAWSA